MNYLTGKYTNTLDDKGRLSLPSRLRAELSGGVLVVKEGEDHCLWAYPPDQWKLLSQTIIASTNPLLPEDRLIRRRFLGSAQEIEIDKAGRISLPQALRESASLSRDCVILGQNDYIEIWDAGEYEGYVESSQGAYRAALEKLGTVMKQNREGL
ncbi:MAG: division/cell wall cluster transcriptional repressor MraZ [Spirochaetaceae bacterium]|jgi:MraZ protein|nr:division/cell wall cluster transcriptional repressor MraZ [Spirochaetaceae bacterium]